MRIPHLAAMRTWEVRAGIEVANTTDRAQLDAGVAHRNARQDMSGGPGSCFDGDGCGMAAALNGPASTQMLVAPRTADIVNALGKICADKAVAVEPSVPQDLAVACEQQDFDEMADNLLDDACRWVRSRVEIQARHDDGRLVAVVIEDDAPPSHVGVHPKSGEFGDDGLPSRVEFLDRQAVQLAQKIRRDRVSLVMGRCRSFARHPDRSVSR
jgi:hypothetical protein